MNKEVFWVTLAVLMSGCASTATKDVVGEYSSNTPKDQMAARIYEQAASCWTDEDTVFAVKSGLKVTTTRELRGDVVNLHFIKATGEVAFEPFTQIVVQQAGSGARVVVLKGGRWDVLTDDSVALSVEDWVSGGDHCDVEYKWQHKSAFR